MITAIILAGGVGSRVGAGRPKQFVEVLGKNDYVLNYDTAILGWDYSCYTCCTLLVKVTAFTQIAI